MASLATPAAANSPILGRITSRYGDVYFLLLKYLQLRSRFGWSLSNLVALLRMNLFTHRDLWAWLYRPFKGPPAVLTTSQGVLALA
jgi:hypothetical protein